MTSVVNLNTWTGVVPVVLPWGEPTITSVGIASAGVAVPFFCYVIAMFMVIIPIWMNNFEDDKQLPAESMSNNNNNNNSENQMPKNSLMIHEDMSMGIMDVPRIEYIIPDPSSSSRSSARMQSNHWF